MSVHLIGIGHHGPGCTRDDHLASWFDALADGTLSAASHPLLSGRCCRILTEHRRWSDEHTARQLAQRCSPGVEPE
jgi:hypothetical protein